MMMFSVIYFIPNTCEIQERATLNAKENIMTNSIFIITDTKCSKPSNTYPVNFQIKSLATLIYN